MADKKQKKNKKDSLFLQFKKRYVSLLSRRPNRSFRLTKRRDAKQPLKIEGYWKFTSEVTKFLWANNRLFGCFILLYTLVNVAIVGFISNEAYNAFSLALDSELGTTDTGGMQGVVNVFTLLGATAVGLFTEPTTEGQNIISGIVLLFGWLTIVWLLRHVMAGQPVRLRDGLYSAGAPFISTLIIAAVIVIQILPVSLGILAYSILTISGIISGGVEAMLLWAVILLLVALSLYWITSSLIALVVVTLPGMYPLNALKKSGDLVVGRRLPIILRLVWAVFVLSLVWIITLSVAIVLHGLIRLDWLPIVPIVVAILSTASLVWFTTYIYMLYRKLIDE